MTPDEMAILKETPEWIAFHKPKDKGGWGVPRKPRVVYKLIHKLLREEKFVMVQDVQNLFHYLRREWDRPDLYACARIELRQIVGERARRHAEKLKVTDKEGAKKLRDRMHDLIGSGG